MTRLLALMPLALLAALLGLFTFSLEHAGEKDASALLGKPAPSFQLTDLMDGRQTVANLAGEAYVINVFASWCLPCRAEIPLLMRLREEGIPILGINWKDTQAEATQWLDTWGNPYARVGADPKGEAALALGISGVPETFVVDAKGRVVFHFAGPLENAWQEEEIVKHFRNKL